jgi:hypothetical protein
MTRLIGLLLLVLCAASGQAADPPAPIPLDEALREKCLTVLHDGLKAALDNLLDTLTVAGVVDI